MQIPFVVVHVPHSAVAVPAGVRRSLLLSDAELERELLRMTDRYTDELFATPSDVARAVVYPVSRLVVDPERFTDDAQEPMARLGMGVIYTRTSDGRELRHPPSPGEREELLRTFYVPHHRRLAEAVDAALDAHGRCLVVDAHSFPSRPLPYEPDQDPDRPDICIGTDAYHTPRFTAQAALEATRAEGWRVALDRPFSGALVPQKHYRRDERVRSVMVEVNRSLYMDESTGKHLDGMSEFQSKLHRALFRLIDEHADARPPARR